MTYTIGETAKLLNLAPSVLRYYDKIGLLPFVERMNNGVRIFKDTDIEWLKIIECLKKTGMSLKDIKTFVHMAMQNDDTIEERLKLITNQREYVKKQIYELTQALEILDYKCWYYETALKMGTVSVVNNMSIDKIPEKYRLTKMKLMNLDNTSENC